MNFFPFDYSVSDRVAISFGEQRRIMKDGELKADPRPLVRLRLPARALSGALLPVCEVPRHGIALSLMVFAEKDTERRRHDRWRVRLRLGEALPSTCEC